MKINAIYNEDCFDIMERQLEDKSIDLILTDPPYGITNCKWDKKIDLERMFCAFNRIIKDHGTILVTATQPFATDVINANRKYFRYDWVWEKTMAVGFANSKRMPMRAHELILVFYKKLPTYNPQGLIKIEKKIKLRRKPERESIYDYNSLLKPYEQEYKNYPRSVLKYSNKNHNSLHPTQKPLDLWEYMILTYSNEGNIVFDPFTGSGTTAIACLETGRKYICCEKEKNYFDIAVERIKNEQNNR